MPQRSLQASAKRSRSSLRPSLSTTSLSSTLDAGAKAIKSDAKRVRKSAEIIARPLKRHRRAPLNNSLQDDIDAEADKLLIDDHISSSTVSNDASEAIEVSSGGEEGEKLKKELGTTQYVSF